METLKNILIRQADESDIQDVFHIVRESSDWMKKEYGFTHWDDYYSLSKIKDNFHKRTVFVLLFNDKPVATYSVGKECPSYYSEEDLSSFSDLQSTAYYLTTLCVLPQYHGKGFAKMLINHLEDKCLQDSIRYLRFDARGIYKELIEFYKKLGFSIVGEILDEGEIYYLFEKEIL